MNTAVAVAERPKLIAVFADRYGLEPERMTATLKATAFNTDKPISNEQLAALLIVANQYKLNPFTKEIYAYPDKGNRIVPVVGVDGWVRIVQEHPMFDGWRFDYEPQEQAYTCTIWRKDRSHPTVITEYMAECRRSSDPWSKMPRRMLRHKSLMQCARVAFGFAGIHDDDEAQEIVRGSPSAATAADRVREVLKRKPEPEAAPSVDNVIDMETMQPRAPEPEDDTNETQALTEYLAKLSKADESAAIELLDLARTDLKSDADYETLVSAYRARFNPEPTDD